jgi:hypothetical protein
VERFPKYRDDLIKAYEVNDDLFAKFDCSYFSCVSKFRKKDLIFFEENY